MDNTTYYQRNSIKIQSKDYYQNDKDRLRDQVRNKYRNLSKG